MTPPRRLADGALDAGPIDGPLSWFPDWRGKTVVAVASGPSATAADLELARGRAEVACVNESWRLAPWAGLLYACDGNWWLYRDGVPDFAGLKVTQDVTAAKRFDLARVTLRIGSAQMLMAQAGVLGSGSAGASGGNSGFQLLNLLLQTGAARLILVGYDLNVAGGIHWHGPHPARLNNPKAEALARWAEALDAQAAAIAAMGVEVINATPASSLAAFPKQSLAEALGA